MSKVASLTQTPSWVMTRDKPSAPRQLIRNQIDGLVAFAKAHGVSLSEFAGLTGDALRDGITAPIKEGFATEAEGLTELFHAEGGCVDVNTAAGLYRKPAPVTRQRIGDLIRAGELIAYRTGSGEYSIPVWQFKKSGGVLAGIQEALAALQKSDTFEPITPFAFFLQEDPLTDGATPLQALRDGKADRVLFAAKQFAE